MKYLVMECHLSYAVVLDEAGQFFKVANMHYEVGQTVTDVIIMQEPQSMESDAADWKQDQQPGEKAQSGEKVKPLNKAKRRWIYGLATMAACLVLRITATLRIGMLPYASVYMTINPEVRIDVNRKDIVVGLEGMNTDGQDLITDYSYKKKELDLVMDELVDLAIDMGYLSAGGKITLTLDAEDDEWVIQKRDNLGNHLNEYLTEKVSVTIQIDDTSYTDQEIVIPSDPEELMPDTDYGETDYGTGDAAGDAGAVGTGDSGSIAGDSAYDAGDSAYDAGDSAYGTGDSGYEAGDSAYGGDAGDSGYQDPGNGGDSVYDSQDDGQTDYGMSSYEVPDSDDGVSDYEAADSDDGDSDYTAPVPAPQQPVDTSTDDGQSDYSSPDNGQTDSVSYDDGQSTYEESDGGDSGYEESDDDD